MASPSQKPDKSFRVGWRGGLYTGESSGLGGGAVYTQERVQGWVEGRAVYTQERVQGWVEGRSIHTGESSS